GVTRTQMGVPGSGWRAALASRFSTMRSTLAASARTWTGSSSRLTGWASSSSSRASETTPATSRSRSTRSRRSSTMTRARRARASRLVEVRVQLAGVGDEPAQEVVGVGRAQPAAAPLEGQGDAEHRGQRRAQGVGDGLEEGALELVEGAQVLGRGPLAGQGGGQAVGGHPLVVEGLAQPLLDLAPLG